jgi:hypothetical protein
MAEIIPDSRVPWIERIPTEETTRSNEWTTSGNRIKPEGSAMIKKIVIIDKTGVATRCKSTYGRGSTQFPFQNMYSSCVVNRQINSIINGWTLCPYHISYF